jgi:predicted dehydrogenase
MARPIKRREFLAATVLSSGYFVAGRAAAQSPRSANGQLNFACIGVGGRGAANTEDAARAGKIVALCDIDETNLNLKANQFPGAHRYFSFNQMLDERASEIDAVVISTPDHTHAAAALKAMRLGKHVYCEKPLCHSVGEARRLSEVAYQTGVVTQMGNQRTADAVFRRTLEAVRSGMIGTIHEVHAWTGATHLPTGPNARPNFGGSPPPQIHWDEFIGPVEFQPYSADFHPSRWGGWWAFGGGPIGATACHILNLAFHAVDLRNPTTIEAQHSGHNRIAFPKSAMIRWEFAATRKRPPVALIWRHGDYKPDAQLLEGEPIPPNGCLLVGDRGKLLCSELFNTSWMLLPERKPLNPDNAYDYYLPAASSHFHEFTDAIQFGGATMSNLVDVGGPMNETFLLGNVAMWADRKIEWDPISLSIKNQPELASIITPTYRAGYTF